MKVILLDCDGPLADFTTAYLDALYEVTGARHQAEEVTQWAIHECDFFRKAAIEYGQSFYGQSVDAGALKRVCDNIVCRRGFCENIKVQPGAQQAVEQLKRLGEVWVVTSPFDSSPTWMHERHHWVHKHFGIPRAHVIQVGRKVRIHGDIFVDDKHTHCIEWQKQWPNGQAFLFDMHHNRDVQKHTGIKGSAWSDIIDAART